MGWELEDAEAAAGDAFGDMTPEELANWLEAEETVDRELALDRASMREAIAAEREARGLAPVRGEHGP